MKKLIALLLALVMVIGLVACGAKEEAAAPAATEAAAPAATEAAKEEASGEVPVLNIWLPPLSIDEAADKPFWDAQFEAFEAENNCQIEVTIVPWGNYVEKYMTGIVGGNGPDVGYIWADMFPDFVSMGALTEFSDRLTDEHRETLSFLNQGIMLGGQYGMPFIVGNPRIIYYNADIMAAEGIEFDGIAPITWEEFIDIAQKVTKDTDGDGATDQWALTMPWGHTGYGIMQEIFFPYLLQAGGEIYNPEATEAIWASEAGIKAANFIHDLVYKYEVCPTTCTGMTRDDAIDAFKNGTSAFLMDNTSGAKLIGDAVNWKYIVCLEDQSAQATGVVDQLVLMSGTEYPDLAWKLMEFMVSADVQTAMHTELQPYAPINADAEYKDNPIFEEMYAKYSGLFNFEKAAPAAADTKDYLYKQLQKFMMNELTAEEALQNAQDYANSVM